MKFLAASLLATASLCTTAVAHASPSSGGAWDWIIAPYGWAASVGTDLRTTTPPSESSVDTSFNDLIDKIDGAFMVRAEGQVHVTGADLHDFLVGEARQPRQGGKTAGEQGGRGDQSGEQTHRMSSFRGGERGWLSAGAVARPG